MWMTSNATIIIAGFASRISTWRASCVFHVHHRRAIITDFAFEGLIWRASKTSFRVTVATAGLTAILATSGMIVTILVSAAVISTDTKGIDGF